MRRHLATVAVTTSTLLAGACGGGGGQTSTATTSTTAARDSRPTTTTRAGPVTTPLAVTVTTETYVDDSHPTVDPNNVRNAPTRTLATDIYVPEGDGPFPLIVHAHGNGGHPRKFTQLLRAWASRGYVVVAPAFPLTNDESGGPSVIADYVNQPSDLRFVLDEVLADARARTSVLYGKIDAGHIGASGLSLGGATAYGWEFNACCRDDRIDAVMILSGFRLPFDDDAYDFSGGTPLFISHGTSDPLPSTTSREVYASAAPPKYFVTLIGGSHAPPYEDTPSPHDAVVTQITTDFWDAYLRGDEASAGKLVQDATVADLSSVEYQR